MDKPIVPKNKCMKCGKYSIIKGTTPSKHIWMYNICKECRIVQ